MKSLSIGIIGGMGPQASALLHQKIVQASSTVLHAHEGHEFPQITHISLPVRDFISDPETRHESGPMLTSAAKIIKSADPDVAIIACNTAHLLVGELPDLAQLPLVSLPHAVLESAAARGVKRLGLIASPTTLRTGLYEHCAEGTGVQIVPLAPKLRGQAERAIRGVIAGKPLPPIQKSLQKLVDDLFSTSVDAVALGCTELSVAMQHSTDPKVIDSLTAATEAAMSRLKQKARSRHE